MNKWLGYKFSVKKIIDTELFICKLFNWQVDPITSHEIIYEWLLQFPELALYENAIYSYANICCTIYEWVSFYPSTIAMICITSVLVYNNINSDKYIDALTILVNEKISSDSLAELRNHISFLLKSLKN